MAQLSLNKLPWYGQVGLFLVLSLVALGGFYYYYVVALEADFEGRRQQLATLRASILKAQTTGRRLAEFQAQVKDLEMRLESLKPILPETKDYGELARRIDDLARQSNINVRGIKPLAIVSKQLHSEWPVGLQVEGTYHNLGYFFDKISNFPRIIHISDLAIRAKEPPTQTATMTADFTATTFVLLETPPGGAAVPPGGAK